MLYVILCYQSESVVASWSREQEQAVLAKREQVMHRLEADRKLGPVARLMPTTAATTVRASRTPLVLDGPFAETKEQLLGIYFVECSSLEEAIGTARDMIGDTGAFEIRPLRAFRPGERLQ